MRTESILLDLKELLINKCGLEFSSLRIHTESIEYGACSFDVNRQKVQCRISKITPTKTGQFVTIWRRNEKGITQPVDVTDDLDFIIVASKSDYNFGLFIFPKSVLAEQGIITQNGKEGKRGIRVYPPWDSVTSKQAEKTQNWQVKHFFELSHDMGGLSTMKRLFS